MVSRVISSPGPHARPEAIEPSAAIVPAPARRRGVMAVLGKVDEVLAWPFRGLVWVYRKTLSPALSPACRFVPSCSEYAEEALRVHGLSRGGALAAWRICRCQPFAKAGWDPVPPARGAAVEPAAAEPPPNKEDA